MRVISQCLKGRISIASSRLETDARHVEAKIPRLGELAMSVDDEKKKPRKAPAKKAATSSEDVTEAKKVKAAAPKPSAPKKKPAAKVVSESPAAESLAVAATMKIPPTHSQIAEQAYAYFVERGRQHGFHEEDWQRAERVLRSEH
jgi:hypothetical protein